MSTRCGTDPGVALVERHFDAFRRGDLEAMLRGMQHDVRLRPLSVFAGGERRGHAGMRALFAEMHARGLEHHIEVEDVVRLADGRIVVVGTVEPCGEAFTGVHVLRDGLVAAAQHYFSDAELLAGLGLLEPVAA